MTQVGQKAVKKQKPNASTARVSGGRPRSPHELVRSEKVTLYLTASEKEQLESGYQLARLGRKLSLNEYAKRRLFTRHAVVNRGVAMQPALLKKLNELVNELKRIGVNYNQSVKRLNQVHFPQQLHQEYAHQAGLAAGIVSLIEQTKQVYTTLENATNS